jgi:FtsP/CotA-like multicopper oxidase with cupredoxin domain
MRHLLFSPMFHVALRRGALALLLLVPAAASAATYTLFIESGTLTVNGAGGAVIKVWGYTDVTGASPMIPGPVLESSEGQSVTVIVYNHHTQPHNFVVRGLSTDLATVPPGGSHSYTFSTPNAGVFMYADTLNLVNREMGLYGAVVVRTSNGSLRAWTNGPAYDIERLWIVSDMDKRNWNDVAGSGGTVNTTTYRPNYFVLNGQGGFDAMHNPKTILQGTTGQAGLVRMVNAGQYDQALHFHANHFQILDVDGKRLSTPESGDTFNLKAGSTAMLMYVLRPGIYPMHVHSAQMETANGVYLNGTATLLIGN